MSKSSFRAAAAALAGILIAIGGCSENPSAATGYQFIHRASRGPLADVSGTSSAVIDARGGSVVTPLGDRITFPAGALTQPTTITVRSSTEYVGVEVEPHGLRFTAGREPVLTLNSAGANVAGYRSLDVVYVGDSGNVEDVLRTQASNGTLTATLPHFSIYTAAGH